MVSRFCVVSDDYDYDAFDDVANSLAYAALLLRRDQDAAALLANSALPAMIDAWYARQGDYLPARDQVLRDLGERAPHVAEHLRLALRASNADARVHSAQQLLALLREDAGWRP
ncbi:MAG TPA: hypothetical protein VFN11_11730 [Ktedonobacterales bacterium]|nr:hypothetical protein [Ktedonobacterales bacterium]